MRIRIPIYKRVYFSIFILIGITLVIMTFTKGATIYNSSTIMNATLLFSISVTPSSALADGIRFGTLDQNTNNNWALNISTGDFSMNDTSTINSTDYNLTVDATTTLNVDFYNSAQYGYLNNTNNDTILVENVTLEANSTWSGTNMNYSINEEPWVVKLNITWMQIGEIQNTSDSFSPCNNSANDGSGGCLMNYFLDVPSGQQSGEYNTTYCYCVVEVGVGSTNCACS